VPQGAQSQGEGQLSRPEAEPLSEAVQTEMLEASEALKAEGNQLYAEQKYQEAANKYGDAIEAGQLLQCHFLKGIVVAAYPKHVCEYERSLTLACFLGMHG
jgi:hypothetical protein